MSLVESRANTLNNKRPFHVAFQEESGAASPKKTLRLPLELAESGTAPTTKEIGDDAALLLIAFASQPQATGGAKTEVSATVPKPPASPTPVDEASRSDSGSDTAMANNYGALDSSSYEDEDDSSDFEVLGTGVAKRLTDAEISGASPSNRRRAGQHFNKRRHRTSAEQLRVLEMTYAGNKVPNQELRKDLATQLGMTTRRVQIWFQNKRAKEKRLKFQAQNKPQHAMDSGSMTSARPLAFQLSAGTASHGAAPTLAPSSVSSIPLEALHYATATSLGSPFHGLSGADSNAKSNPLTGSLLSPPPGLPMVAVPGSPHNFVAPNPRALADLLNQSMRDQQRLAWVPPVSAASVSPLCYLQMPPPTASYQQPYGFASHAASPAFPQLIYPHHWALPTTR